MNVFKSLFQLAFIVTLAWLFIVSLPYLVKGFIAIMTYLVAITVGGYVLLVVIGSIYGVYQNMTGKGNQND